MASRLILAGVAIVVGVGLFEGGHAFVTGEPSVLTKWLHPRLEAPLRTGMLDEERMKAAALTAGPFDEDVDRRVGGRFKAGLDRKILSGRTTTDRFGQRVRPGSPPEPGAMRIVVLGDSVAFGFGVDDDENFGHRLETWLGKTTPEGAPPPAVWTVACPGWNTASETRFLLNHIQRLDPDVVILIPVENDLDDRFRVNGLGHREGFVPEPGLPQIALRHHVKLFLEAYPRAPLQMREAHLEAGGRDVIAPALLAGAGRESKRRWAVMFSDINNLKARLEARGARLCVAHTAQDTFTRVYGARIRAAIPDIERAVLVGALGPEDSLSNDPHGNAGFLDLCGRIMAEWLLQREWWPKNSTPLPAHEVARERRATPLDPAEARTWALDLEERQRRFAGPLIDLRTAIGFHQIYGGIAADGVMGRRALVAVRRKDPVSVVRIQLHRLPKASGVYPLRIAVTVNGEGAGSFQVEPPDGDPLTYHELAIPAPQRAEDWFDIGLEASNWVIEKHPELEVTRPISCRVGIEIR